MSTAEHDLMRAAEALTAESGTTIQALVSALAATADAVPAIAARATALQAENARRVRAGVRVVTNPDGFDARQIAMLRDALAATDTRMQGSTRCVSALSGLLARSLALLAQMTAALAAPERAAAEAARDEAQAEKAKEAERVRNRRELAAHVDADRARALAEGREI